MARIVIDAGHGGYDNGAVYQGRQEKNDNLDIALAVGEILQDKGVDVVYTRVDDVYDSPVRKAEIANQLGGDFLFPSIGIPVRNQIRIPVCRRLSMMKAEQRQRWQKISMMSWRMWASMI